MAERRPLISSAPLSEFGDLPASEVFNDPYIMDRDATYVPGFSEMRRTRDLKVGDYIAGQHGWGPQIAASEVPVLPVNLRWARAQKKSGEPDSEKAFAHSRKGYKLVNKSDIGKPWLTSLPPGAQELPDGTIRNGDMVLMVADQKSAARNELLKRHAVDKRTNAISTTFERLMEKEVGVDKTAAAAPTINKDVGKK